MNFILYILCAFAPLWLQKPEVTATGTIEYIAKEKDGDYHLRLRLDSQSYLLNDGNIAHQHGCLLLEIVPGNPLPRPRKGSHVKVTGTWILDKHHGWNEIHPVNSIFVL